MFFFFFPVAAIALIGAHYYLYRRLIRPIPHRTARRAASALFLLLLILVSFGTVLYRFLPAATTRHFQQLGYVWMTIGLYCLLALLAIDLATLAVWVARQLRARGRVAMRQGGDSAAVPSAVETRAAMPAGDGKSFSEGRRRFLMNSGLLGLGLALPTSAWGFWRAAHCRIPRVEIRLDRFPEHLAGFSIALLSDIHAGGWVGRDFVQGLVDRANALKPDAIFIAGDLVDGDVPSLAHIVAPLAELRARHGTFFVIGNHEIYSGVDAWVAHVKGLGIRVLRNERADLDGLDLLGVDDWSAAKRGITPGYDLDAVLAQRSPNRPAILLTHQPLGFRKAAEQGIDLQLSGHTHGGQLFPFQPFARRANEGYLAGLYRHGKGQLYVTRGCGYWGPPARVGAPPEITHLILLPSAGAAR